MMLRSLLALGAYLLALAVTAPATLIDAGLQRTSDGRLRLAEAHGTLWSGSGRIEFREGGGVNGISRRLDWRIAPAALLRGRVVCDVGLEQAAGRFPVTMTLSRIELAHADLSLPASVLGLVAPRLALLGLSGEVRIQVVDLSVARDGMYGGATLHWLAAGSTLTPIRPLGDYEILFAGRGRIIDASLRTLAGPLQLDGKGSWRQGDRPGFLAMARVPAQQQPQLAPLLRLIAIEREPGSFELQLNGAAP